MSLAQWSFDELITAVKLSAPVQLLNAMADSGQAYLKMFVRTHLQKLGISSPQNGYYLFNDSTKTAQVFVDGRWYELQMVRADHDISGTVTNALSGLPIAGVAVTANGNQTTATDASGNYSLSNVPKGTAVTVGGVLTGYNAYNSTVNISAGNATKDFTMARRSITGNITSSLDGAVVSGVTVEIAALPRSTSSNGSGNYSLIDVPDGSHTLAASKSGYVSYSSGISVSGDQVRNIVMDPITWTVSGAVTSSATGASIPGVPVTIGSRPSVTSDGSGNYSRNTVPDGSHSVTAAYPTAGYYSSYSDSVTVSGANQTKNISLTSLERSINPGGGTYGANGGAGTAYGFLMTLSKPLRVTKLGFYNWDAASGRSYRLKIWNSAGFIVASADVSGSTLGWHYGTLGVSVLLPAGDYTFSAYVVGSPSNYPFLTSGPGISHEAVTVTADVWNNGGGDTRPAGVMSSHLQPRGFDLKVQM